MGYANGGRLQNAARLAEDETLRFVPGRMLHFGTDELIGLIRRSARVVFRRHHVRLSVGDLSASHGGPVGHHASHQSGRDADLSFYVLNAHGQTAYSEDYVGFRGDGTPIAGGALRFDTARNWALIEALIEDPVIRVEHIFVSNGLRSALLEYARSHAASAAAITRAESVMHQPVHGSPHANHFHVRIACPQGDGGCVDGVRYPPRRRRAVAREQRRHHGAHPREHASR
jgi:penicillin-insensitive murein endopeptidase